MRLEALSRGRRDDAPAVRVHGGNASPYSRGRAEGRRGRQGSATRNRARLPVEASRQRKRLDGDCPDRGRRQFQGAGLQRSRGPRPRAPEGRGTRQLPRGSRDFPPPALFFLRFRDITQSSGTLLRCLRSTAADHVIDAPVTRLKLHVLGGFVTVSYIFNNNFFTFYSYRRAWVVERRLSYAVTKRGQALTQIPVRAVEVGSPVESGLR